MAHPETRHGVIGSGREKSRKLCDSTERFTSDTSSKTGQSERTLFTKRRKEAYEALHPETKAHVAGAHGANAAQGNASAKLAPAFTSDVTARHGGDRKSSRQLGDLPERFTAGTAQKTGRKRGIWHTPSLRQLGEPWPAHCTFAAPQIGNRIGNPLSHARPLT